MNAFDGLIHLARHVPHVYLRERFCVCQPYLVLVEFNFEWFMNVDFATGLPQAVQC